ncbi:MAG: HAD family phosphatase [Lachnospiraceae bacterium]|nr:HAD family phosphatase [Lachnospiraceae bacterium]
MWMWFKIDVEYLGRFGLDYEEGLQQKVEGMSFSETAVFFKEHFNIPDSLEKIKQDWLDMAYHKYAHEVFEKDGVLELLSALRDRGFKVGICTSNSIDLVNAVLSARGLDAYIDCIVTGCEVQNGKPAPDVYLEAAKRLQVLPEECVVFEDIVPGILAGKNAGMKTVAVADEYSTQFWRNKCEQADYNIDSYRQLI